MTDIKLPFGLNESNTLVHIADVESGKKCGCICPSCREALIAAKGNIRQHHFRHDVDRECESGLESAIHLAAKKLIREKKQITLPGYCLSLSSEDSRWVKHTEQEIVVREGMVARFNAVEEEKELHAMKADLLATKDNTPLIIEIFYRHKVDNQKLSKIVAANISAIEIDLSDLTPEDVKNWDAFWTRINVPQRIQWLHNAKADGVRKRLKNRLEETIRTQEGKYKAAAIKLRKQEERERERLLHALTELQNLSADEKHKERLRQNAEKHEVWKYHSRYLSFSLQELPNFLNVGVPDGDWIFGCDRRVWQAAFYSYFICKNGGSFTLQAVDNWLQNTLKCKAPACAATAGILGRRYPQLVPANLSGNLPSSWRTLRAYFEYLCELGVIKFSHPQREVPGSSWYKVINQAAIK